MKMIRRPWGERLVRNCNGITAELTERFERETSINAYHEPAEFLAWCGLKDTPTARLRVKQAQNKGR